MRVVLSCRSCHIVFLSLDRKTQPSDPCTLAGAIVLPTIWCSRNIALKEQMLRSADGGLPGSGVAKQPRLGQQVRFLLVNLRPWVSSAGHATNPFKPKSLFSLLHFVFAPRSSLHVLLWRTGICNSGRSCCGTSFQRGTRMPSPVHNRSDIAPTPIAKPLSSGATRVFSLEQLFYVYLFLERYTSVQSCTHDQQQIAKGHISVIGLCAASLSLASPAADVVAVLPRTYTLTHCIQFALLASFGWLSHGLAFLDGPPVSS